MSDYSKIPCIPLYFFGGDKMVNKVRGGVITTSQENQEIIDDGNKSTVILLTNISFENLGETDIHCKINYGDEITVFANETIKMGDLKVESIIVKETGSKVRFMGIE